MRTKVRWVSIALLIVLASAGIWAGISFAQMDGVEGMQAPDDVTGADCTMCHGTFAQDFKFPHQPAFDKDCASCHQTTGNPGHGALTDDSRGLCLGCHTDKQEHYAAATCWSAGCHADMHGSNVNAVFIPSRAEEYPGFVASTEGAAYVGSAKCLECHTEQCKWYGESIHSLSDADAKAPPERQGCESCHGPGGNHWGRWAGIGNFAQANAAEADDTCLKCHRDETYVPDYQRSIHAKSGVACISCHNPHNLTDKHNLVKSPNEVCFSCHETKRVDFVKTSHHPVDLADNRTGMLCTDCHNPHGGDGAMMLNTAAEDLCMQCHVDKSGPFVYSHAGYEPGLSRGCFTCHTPHGSSAPNLLSVSDRGTCLQCHTDMAQHMSGKTCWTTGCHTAHHGSNSDFLFFK